MVLIRTLSQQKYLSVCWFICLFVRYFFFPRFACLRPLLVPQAGLVKQRPTTGSRHSLFLFAPIGEVAWKKKAFLSSTGLFTKWERDLDFGWRGFRTRASAIAKVTKAISVVKVSAGGGGGTLGGWLISMAERNEGGKTTK